MAKLSWRDLRKKAGKLAETAGEAFEDAKTKIDEAGIREQLNRAANSVAAGYEQAAALAEKGRDAAWETFWTRQIGKEDAQKVKEVLEAAQPHLTMLRAYKKDAQKAPTQAAKLFTAEVQKETEQGSAFELPEQKEARQALHAAKIVIATHQGDDTLPDLYALIAMAAESVNTLYQDLPQSYVDTFAAIEAKKDSAMAQTRQLGDSALQAGGEAYQHGKEKAVGFAKKLFKREP